jgi:hypothetical protein
MFFSGLRSSAFIVIASAGHDKAHNPQAVQFFYLVRHVLIGVDHGKLDSFHVFRILNGNFSCKQMFDCDYHSFDNRSRYILSKKDISLLETTFFFQIRIWFLLTFLFFSYFCYPLQSMQKWIFTAIRLDICNCYLKSK